MTARTAGVCAGAKWVPLLEEYGQGSQDLTYMGMFEVAGKRVRVRIRRDSYDFQSHAIAEVWSKALDTWQNAASIHYSKMASLVDSYYDRNNDGRLQHHWKDVDTLLERVRVTLGGTL